MLPFINTKKFPELIGMCWQQCMFGGLSVDITSYSGFGREYIDIQYRDDGTISQANKEIKDAFRIRFNRTLCNSSFHWSSPPDGWYFLDRRQSTFDDIACTDDREEVYDGFHLIFQLLDMFGIKINELNICGIKSKDEILTILSRETSAEKKRRIEESKDASRRMYDFVRLAQEMSFDLKMILGKLSGVPESDYVRLCRGTIKKNKYTQELKELKFLTDKITHYIPDVADTADALVKSTKVMAKAYENVCDALGAFSHWDFSGRCASYSGWMERLCKSLAITEIVFWSRNELAEYVDDFFQEHYDAIVESIKGDNA